MTPEAEASINGVESVSVRQSTETPSSNKPTTSARASDNASRICGVATDELTYALWICTMAALYLVKRGRSGGGIVGQGTR
eukprot:gene3341-4201_t